MIIIVIFQHGVGTDTYTYNSHITYAAWHMGIVPLNERKTLYIKIVKSPVGGYKGTTKNRVKTSGQSTIDTSVNGYIFVTEDGTEIKSPVINSFSASGGENSINVTLDVDYKNGATENKCYYSIYDDVNKKWSNYIEGNIENNVCTFEVLPHENYTIKAYVVDSRGVSSEEFTITAKASNEIPMPEMKILKPDSEEEFTERDLETLTVNYKGEIWYPYGTKVKFIYPEDMTNLSGVCRRKYIFGSYTDSYGWTASAGDNNYLTAYETVTYSARIEDRTREMIETEPLTIHIMPSANYGFNSQSHYTRYCAGQIFPVIATGTKSGTLFGTDIYSYDSNIGKAAMHMGLVNEGETKTLYIKLLEDEHPYFEASTRNGVISNEANHNSYAYIFVTEDGNPISAKGEITSDIIDDTGITFSYDYTDCEDKAPYEYDGKTWYPYGTEVTINFSGEGTYRYYHPYTYNNTTTWRWDTVSSSVKYTISKYNYFIAEILDSSGKTIHRKALMLNVMLPPSKSWLVSTGTYLVKVNGNVEENEIIEGTGTYHIGNSIRKAAVHMGLVNLGDNTEHTFYVKVNYDNKSYNFIGSSRNGVYSKNYNTTIGNRFTFVDKYGTNIPAYNKGNDVTLSGYKVVPTTSGNPCFINDGTSIVPENEVKNNDVDTESYIELDLRNYEPSDTVKLTLDVNLGFTPNTTKNYEHYGAIKISRVNDSGYDAYNYGYLIKTDGTVENGTKESDNIYSKRVAGGAKYRIYFIYKNNNAESGTMRINSLNVEKSDTAIKIVPVDETIQPFIDKEGNEWYPWNTKFKMIKTLGDYVYYTINNSTNSRGTFDTTEKEIVLVQPSILKFGYENNYSMNEHSQAETNIYIMPFIYGGNYGHFDNVNIGKIYPVKVKQDISGSVYGNEKYEYSTYISKAAEHMGLLDDIEEKYLYIKVIKSPEGGYKSATKNGIISAQITNALRNGFVFVTEDGTEILEPIINSGTASIGEESALSVTVDAVGQNGAKIEKYYYNIDNGKYIEGANNTYTFTVENPNSMHRIGVYVRDSNGAISQTKEILTSSTNGAPTITLTDSNGEPILEENIVHYNGVDWYPYGTIVTVNFAEDMTNLIGSYGYIDERTGVKNYWYNTNNKTYTTQLSYSKTYMAKLMNTITNKETEEARKTVYIMPSDELGPRYYYENAYLGNIYPVRVIGTDSGNTYGTDVYYPNSNINKAATHMGLVEIGETKTVYIKIVKSPVGGYIGNTRNRVTTVTTSDTPNGFVFVDENGNEITRPKVDTLIVSSGDKKITVTANSNNSNSVKYYYSIDNGDYFETEDNHYTFENITKSGEHTIKVYVKDSNGNESAVKEIKGRRNIPTPIFEFNQEPIMYNGEKWYPYNTKITVKFNEDSTDMTNLYGGLRYMNAYSKSKVMSNWNNSDTTISSSPYLFSSGATESMVVEAYTYEKNVGEGEHIREKINIMPDHYGLPTSYWQYGSGDIFPVQVTGGIYDGYSLYGTDTYDYRSNISKAATHAGLVKEGETKIVYIRIVPCPEGGYKGSTQNGITSRAHGNTYVGFTFVK